MTQLLAPEQVAKILQLTPRQIIRLANRGEIPLIVMPTGGRRFVEDDIAAWIDQHRATGEKAGEATP